MVEQAIPGGVHLSTDAYTRLLARLAQAEAKVERVRQVPDWLAANGMSPQEVGFVRVNIDAALSGDADPRTDGDTR
jgi:hypothetical protein